MNAISRTVAERVTGIRVALELTGLEPALSEMERMVQENARRFAETVMRPAGQKLDRMAPKQTIAPDSPLWAVMQGAADLGFTVGAVRFCRATA